MEHIPDIERAAGALVAAGGLGAAGEFGRRLASSASDWLAERFGHSAEAARETAARNGAAFQNELAERVKHLEDSAKLPSGQAERAFERPDTLAALQAGYTAASESADPVKRGVLAALVADRLRAVSDSLEAVT